MAAGGDIRLDKPGMQSGRINIPITAEAGEASTITLSGLALYINRSIPDGKYNLAVGGDSWVKSYDETDNGVDSDKFDKGGYMFEGYIDVITSGSNRLPAPNVKVQIGTASAWVDGEAVELMTETRLIEGSTMIPLRAISIVLGIPEGDIMWDDTAKTVTIVTADKVIVFTVESSKMSMNGADVSMFDANGIEVTPINIEGSVFVPFRQLGNAFGIEVAYIPGNPAYAVLNPTEADTSAAGDK